MQPRFRTLKSVRNLLPGRPGLYNRFREVSGWGRFRRRLIDIFHLENQLYAINHELVEWSRLHRRLNNGRPAVIDEWMTEHSTEIRTALTALGQAVDELASMDTLSDAQRGILDNYRLELHAAWQLDLTEPEAHEIQRRQPVPKVEAPVPAPAQPPTDWQPRKQMTDLFAALLEVLGEKSKRPSERPSEPTPPAPVRSWLTDVMVSSPYSRMVWS